jgi:hypothetical protein
MQGCMTGAGYHDFELVNAWQDARIVAFTGGIDKPVVLASSPAITFTDYAAPLRGHVSRTALPTEMRAVWNTKALDAAQQTQWGTTSGVYTSSALSEPHTYTVDDMCGNPAKTQGWYNPGWWNYALMTGLKPDTVYYYRYGSPEAWSSEFSFRTPPVPGPHAPVNLLVFADMGMTEYDGTVIHWNEPDAGMTTQHMSDMAHGTGDGYNYTLAVHAGDISYAT